MNKTIFLLVISVFFVAHKIQALDSLGIEKRESKIFVIHKVDAGETAFSIAKRYGTTVLELTRSNPDATPNISIGQVLKVPFGKKVMIVDPEATYHEVKTSETLYSISKKYNTTVDDLIKWNKLEANSLKIGQRLIVYADSTSKEIKKSIVDTPILKDGKLHTVEQGQTLYSISKQYEVTVDQLMEWNDLEGNNLDIGSEIVVGEGNNLAEVKIESPVVPKIPEVIVPTTTEVADTVLDDSRKGGSSPRPRRIESETPVKSERHEKVTETGLAELIEGSNNTRKYLALHKTAPVGTIMQVKNEMNNLSVFVRVVGKLPATGGNEKLILKISQKAYDRLGAVDKRIRVQINYAP